MGFGTSRSSLKEEKQPVTGVQISAIPPLPGVKMPREPRNMYLIGKHPEGMTIHRIAKGEKYTVGRQGTIKINEKLYKNSLKYNEISREHFTIENFEQQPKITDHSKNGTIIGKKEIKEKSYYLSPKEETIKISDTEYQLKNPEQVSQELLSYAGLEVPKDPIEKTEFYDKLFRVFSKYSLGSGGIAHEKKADHPIHNVKDYSSSEGTPEYSFLNSFIKGKYYGAAHDGMIKETENMKKIINRMRKHRDIVDDWRGDMPIAMENPHGLTKFEKNLEKEIPEIPNISRMKDHAELHQNQAKKALELGRAGNDKISFNLVLKHLKNISEKM